MSCPEPRRPVRDLHANPWLLCGFHGLEMTLFPMAVITWFWRYQADLGMTQILVLQAAFSLTMAIAEFPSGYMADRIGYRRILIVCSLCMAAGWGIYCVSSSFAALLIAEMIQGLACSLISGCDSALLCSETAISAS